MSRETNPDSKVHEANMGPTWVLSAPDGPHAGPMNLAIRELIIRSRTDLLLVFCQTITWTDADLMSILPLGILFNIFIYKILKIETLSYEKTSAKWRPFCFGLSVFPVTIWAHNAALDVTVRIMHQLWSLKNAHELLNLRALKISMLYKNHIFQCKGKIFCVEFQRLPLKFQTKYLTHTLKDVDFIHRWNLKAFRFKSSYVFLKRSPELHEPVPRGLDMQGNTWHFCRWAKWPTCWKRHFLIHFWDTNGTDVAGDHIIKMAWCWTGNKPLPEPTTTQIYWRIYASPCHDVFMYRARISYNLAGVADSAFNRILWKVCLSFDSPGSYLPLYSLNGNHDDVIKWKHFPCYWPFVPGIHRWSVNSPHKGQWHGALMFSLTCVLNKRLNKQYWGWWFETPSRSLWRHCNEALPPGLT